MSSSGRLTNGSGVFPKKSEDTAISDFLAVIVDEAKWKNVRLCEIYDYDPDCPSGRNDCRRDKSSKWITMTEFIHPFNNRTLGGWLLSILA
jgi:hypothetical protein